MPTDTLSTTFAALADPTRRAILARLTSGEASVTELAEPFEMSLPAVSKHLKVLERAGLIARGREAQWRPCRLRRARSRTPTSGWNDIAVSGRRASIAWTNTWEKFKSGRRNRATTRFKRRRRRMADASNAPTASTQQDLVITRIFDAPRELVWKAWTEPEHMMRWWGPKGFTRPSARSTSAWAASSSTACVARRQGLSGARASIAKSFRRSGSFARTASPTRKATWSRLRTTG